jgi:RNA-binding protein YlmH
MSGKAEEVRDWLLETGRFVVGAGWAELVADMLLEILERLESAGVDLQSIAVRDFEVKEKRGRLVIHSLRFDGVDDIAERYELKSLRVCEVCGAAGQLSGDGGWWLSTRCNQHRIF